MLPSNLTRRLNIKEVWTKSTLTSSPPPHAVRATTAVAATVALQHPTADTICRQCNTPHMAGDARSRQVGMIPRATSKAAAVRVRCLISTGMCISHLGGDRSASLVGQIFIFRTMTNQARHQVLDGVGEGSGRRLGCDDKRSAIAAPIDAKSTGRALADFIFSRGEP